MRLAVIDTNVIVAAAINPHGPPGILLYDWILEGRVQTVVSPFIIAEYRDVAHRAKFLRFGFPPLWLESLIEQSLVLADHSLPSAHLPDPKDVPLLATSHVSGATLVTGNLKHFPAMSRYGVTVLSPAAYLAHLTGTPHLQ